MNRRQFVATLAAPLLAADSRPNIVFVLTDDQGYGDIHSHGNPVVKTPNLDRLREQSVRLLDYNVSPTCAPTRTALYTGRHEFKSGVTHTIYERERMSLRSTTIAQVLRDAGYSTGIFGKWHLGDAPEYQPNQRGFEESFIHGCGGIGQVYPGTCSDAPGNTYFDPAINHNGKFEKTKGYCTDVFFAQALSWVDAKRNSGKPLFALITTNAPHVPLQVPEAYQRMYPDLDQNTAKYFGMVANIDENVGRLMGKLKEWGMERNTLLVFMTDNGGTGGVKVFNDGMRGMKNTPYRGGTRVPAFFRWTGTLQPGERAALTAHIDLFPTFVELAKASVPKGLQLDGRSLVPLLRNANAGWSDRYLFTHCGRWDKGKAAEAKYERCRVRSNRYSLINIGKEKKWELYDLLTDPGEKTDIAAGQPGVVAKMDAAYEKWWAEVFPLLVNEDAVPPKVAPYRELFEKQYSLQ